MILAIINEAPTFDPPKGLGSQAVGSLHSKKLEHGCRMIYVGFPFFFGFGLEDGHVPIFWVLLQKRSTYGL